MDRLPLILLTGFLGSGKTTLLRRILASPGMAGTAVLINEFGEIGLDHLLVRSVQGNAVVLQNGCICCTIRSDLQQGLRGLFELRGGNEMPRFDRIAVETTGIADPAPIAHTLTVDPMLRHQIRLSNIVTTIDAVLGMEQLDRHGEALRQAAIADRLVITKSDIAGQDAVEALRKRLTELNPSGRLFDAHAPDFDVSSLLREGIADPATKLAEVRHWLAAADVATAHGPHDSHDHGGGSHADIRTFSLRIEEAVDWTAFGVWLTSLLHRHGSKVLRVKGLLDVPDALGPIVLHGVQHVIHPPTHLDAWPDGDRASRIVFVVQGLDPAAVKASLDRFLAAARVGQPQEVSAVP